MASYYENKDNVYFDENFKNFLKCLAEIKMNYLDKSISTPTRLENLLNIKNHNIIPKDFVRIHILNENDCMLKQDVDKFLFSTVKERAERKVLLKEACDFLNEAFNKDKYSFASVCKAFKILLKDRVTTKDISNYVSNNNLYQIFKGISKSKHLDLVLENKLSEYSLILYFSSLTVQDQADVLEQMLSCVIIWGAYFTNIFYSFIKQIDKNCFNNLNEFKEFLEEEILQMYYNGDIETEKDFRKLCDYFIKDNIIGWASKSESQSEENVFDNIEENVHEEEESHISKDKMVLEIDRIIDAKKSAIPDSIILSFYSNLKEIFPMYLQLSKVNISYSTTKSCEEAVKKLKSSGIFISEIDLTVMLFAIEKRFSTLENFNSKESYKIILNFIEDYHELRKFTFFSTLSLSRSSDNALLD